MLNILEIQGGIIYACVPFVKPITLRVVSPVRSMVQRRSKGLFSSSASGTGKSVPEKSGGFSRALTPAFGRRTPRPTDDLEDYEGSVESQWKDQKVGVSQRPLYSPLTQPDMVAIRPGSSTTHGHRHYDSESTVTDKVINLDQEGMMWEGKLPAGPFASSRLAASSVISMSTIATDGSGLIKPEDETPSGLSPAQIPRPRAGSRSEEVI